MKNVNNINRFSDFYLEFYKFYTINKRLYCPTRVFSLKVTFKNESKTVVIMYGWCARPHGSCRQKMERGTPS